MNTPVLSLTNVDKDYRGAWTFRPRRVLRDISFSIQAGESVGFIGHNGAGKTTTIRIALGLQRPTQGRVLLNGFNPTKPEARIGVAYVPENPLLYDSLSPRQLLWYSAGFSRRQDVSGERGDPAECLDRFGLSACMNVPIRQLSKGLAQRLAIASAFYSAPKFMILDEPMTGLDPVARNQLIEVLADYRKGGGTLLFSSHALLELEKMADRFICIRQGEILASGTFRELAAIRPDDETFLVEVESDSDLAGFERQSSIRWKRTVGKADLPGLLQELGGMAETRVLSVTNTANAESAYLSLIASVGTHVPD